METKICIKCSIEQDISEYAKRKSHNGCFYVRNKCRLCTNNEVNIRSVLYFQKNKDIIVQRRRPYSKKYLKSYQANAKRDLTDIYIKKLLTYNGVLLVKDLTPQLIELKRKELTLKRKLK